MKRKALTWLVLFALWLMVFSASSQVIIVTPILPEISAALGIPETLQGTLVTAYAVMLSVFALITGPISDRIGRRRILLIGSGTMAVVLWLHGLADTYLMLLIMRSLAGAAGGMLTGGAVAYVGDYFPYERRGWANGWVMSGMAFGQVVGIPIGKVLADTLGFHWPFLMFAATMTFAAFLIWRYIPQPPLDREEGRLSLRSAVAGYWRLVQRREIRAAAATYFLMFFSIGVFVVFFPTWLEREVGVTGGQIALLFAIGGLANVGTGPLAGWLSDRTGRKPLIIVSCLGLGTLILLTTFVINGFASAAVFFALLMAMVAMRISPFQSLLTALVSGRRRGILMSLAVGVGQLGNGIGSSVAGMAYMEYGYVSNTLIGALAVFLMALIVRTELPEPEAETAAGIRPGTPA